ncbi:hypothetical protein F4860DRAFT_528447 [Xylaria cubensis]|nr:hypothetical protein F4860DRAFT_528447 [Xylaria cubensis]
MDSFAIFDEQDSISSFSSNSRLMNTPPSTETVPKSDRDTTSMSSYSNSSTFTIRNLVTSVPEPGNTYKIVEVDSERAISLVRGSLTLVLDTSTRGGWQWDCEEHPNGWIGFREAVSGKFLGHDNKGGYIAQASKLDSWESFVLRRRAAGGYNLCVKYGHKLKPMGISESDGPTPKLVDAKSSEEAARWEFYKIPELGYIF